MSTLQLQCNFETSLVVIMTTGYEVQCYIRTHMMYSCIFICDKVVVNVIAEMVGSWWLALIFQTSHVVSEVSGDVIRDDVMNNDIINTVICT